MLLDMLKTRRSVRRFKKREIEKEKLETILKCALLAPSSRGKRPWQFITVTDGEIIKKLSSSKNYGSQFLEGAPVAIVVLGDTKASDVWVEDTSIASTIIHLAAHELGLGSCWIQIRERFQSESQKSEDYVRELLNIPENYGVLSIIAIGYPDETKQTYDENISDSDKLHLNRF